MVARRTVARHALPATALVTVLATACTQPAEQSDNEEAWQDLSIATGTTAGVYYPVGGAISEIINDNVDDVNSSTESTGASVENMRLIEGGESQMGLVQGDVAYQAFHGEGEEFEGESIDARVLMVVYPNVYHAVTLQSIAEDQGLECFGDVEGTRFSVGAPGSGNEVATSLVFDGIGLTFDDVDVHRYAYAETADALREGELDAGSWVVGESHGSLLELEATDPIHLIEMCEDERDTITDAHPFYQPHTIEGGTYETVEDDVETLALWNVLVVPADFPEDVADQIIGAIYDNTDTIGQVYEPGTPYFTPETLANSPIPLHPSAVSFAEDQGVEIPDELRP